MTRISPIKFVCGAAAVPLVALAVAGCGGSANSTRPAAVTSTHGSATVEIANSSLGRILVDSKGRTLYLFKKDSGTKSTCFGTCAINWPPERVTTKPTVGSGLGASRSATTARSDGKPEITYNGHPLYLFAGDMKPGDTRGQGVSAFGGRWFALSPAGTQVSGSGSAPGGAGGY